MPFEIQADTIENLWMKFIKIRHVYRGAVLLPSFLFYHIAKSVKTMRKKYYVTLIYWLFFAVKPLEKEPAIILSSTTIKAGKGENTVLECGADGSPPPNITWDRYGGRLAPDRHTVKSGNEF